MQFSWNQKNKAYLGVGGEQEDKRPVSCSFILREKQEQSAAGPSPRPLGCFSGHPSLVWEALPSPGQTPLSSAGWCCGPLWLPSPAGSAWVGGSPPQWEAGAARCPRWRPAAPGGGASSRSEAGRGLRPRCRTVSAPTSLCAARLFALLLSGPGQGLTLGLLHLPCPLGQVAAPL